MYRDKYAPSDSVIANVVLGYLDLNFQDKRFEKVSSSANAVLGGDLDLNVQGQTFLKFVLKTEN